MSIPFMDDLKSQLASKARDKQISDSGTGDAAYSPPGGKDDPNDMYSKDAAAKQAANRVSVTGDTHSDYTNPGSADFGGGPGMAGFYKDSAANHISPRLAPSSEPIRMRLDELHSPPSFFRSRKALAAAMSFAKTA